MKLSSFTAPKAALYLLLTATTMLLGGCHRADPDTPTEPASKRIPVEIARPVKWDGIDVIRSMGRLETEDTVTFSFKSPGVIEDILVDTGDRVQKAQLLAQLERTELQSFVRRAEESVQKTVRDLTRMKSLFERGVVPRQSLDDAQTANEIAQAELSAARFNLGLTEIRASQDGLVLNRNAEPREIVQPGQPILKVSGIDSGWLLQLDLSDREVVALADLQQIEVYFDAIPDQPFGAEIARIAGESDPATAMFQVELRLTRSNPRLRPGLLGTAFITVKATQTGLLIPVSALTEAARDTAFVYVVESGTARRRNISTGELRAEGIVVTDGLTIDDVIITGGAGFVDDGSPVSTARD